MKIGLFACLVTACLFPGCTVPRDNAYDPKNPDYVPLSPPAGFSCSALSETSVGISWQDGNAIEDGYGVLRRLPSENVWHLVCLTGEDGSGCADNDLDTGTLYYYRGFGFNVAADTAYTHDIVQVRTWLAADSVLTRRPYNLHYSLDKQDDLSIYLTWEPVLTNVRGYVVEKIMEGSSFFSILDSQTKEKHYYLDYGIKPALRHQYRVAAYNNSGLGPYSETLNVYIGSPFKKDSSTVGLWYMDNLNGDSVMYDSSGHGNNGRLKRVRPVNEGLYGNCYFLYAGDSSEITVPCADFPESVFVLEFWFKPASSMDSASGRIGIVSIENGPVEAYYNAGFFNVLFTDSTSDTLLSARMDFSSRDWTLITLAASRMIKDVLVNRIHKFYVYGERPYRRAGAPVIHFGTSPVEGTPAWYTGRFDEARLLNAMKF